MILSARISLQHRFCSDRKWPPPLLYQQSNRLSLPSREDRRFDSTEARKRAHILHCRQSTEFLGAFLEVGRARNARRSSQSMRFKHLSSGDLLRADVQSGSARGGQLKAMMEAGQLVPLTIVLDLIKEAMVKAVEDKKCKGFLIDGYPREVQQGIDFEREIQPSKLVFYFDVTNEKPLIERLLKRAQTRISLQHRFCSD
ncbi:adenylate kinase domain-containing protein [Ditylenchus destructor]|uniref:Adenylate kinase domain-containing protein n=1 Tax=Ditylenchus destructor TaxID=166010 RepID=A0AAD4MQV8_9BILA|nr:adenylate kinase domain-containing protein [Ditylenchus destructor]